MARATRGGTSVAPTGMKGFLSLCQVQVLSGVQYDGIPMDGHQCLLALRKLAGLLGGVEIPVESRKVQRVQRKPKKQRVY